MVFVSLLATTIFCDIQNDESSNEKDDVFLMISSELPEILGMTDRVVVFHEGEVMGILETAKTNQEEIMQYASGVKRMAL